MAFLWHEWGKNPASLLSLAQIVQVALNLLHRAVLLLQALEMWRQTPLLLVILGGPLLLLLSPSVLTLGHGTLLRLLYIVQWSPRKYLTLRRNASPTPL